MNVFVRLALLTVFGSVILPNTLEAATLYISPKGSDNLTGTSPSNAWLTFSHAVARLNPGDTLILRDGTYTNGNTGLIDINCSSNASNATASAPITIVAENERRALLQSNGITHVVRIRNCSYWRFSGLRGQSRVNTSGSGGQFYVRDSSHITLSRLLLTHNNRYYNTALLMIWSSSQVLVDESEFYHFHRHAITNWESVGNTYRRNYYNSRFHADIPGGYVSARKDRGEKGVALYPGKDCIIENNISENNGGVMELNATFNDGILADNNRIFGSISLNDHHGALPNSRGDDLNHMPQNTTFTNLAAINVGSGVFARTTKNTRCINCTFINNSLGFNADLQASGVGDGNPTAFVINGLAVGNAQYGFRFTKQSSYGTTFSNAYNNGTNYSPSNSRNNSTSIDPKIGSCLVFIPNSSPMKGAGQNGADIGANILFQYKDGRLTNMPLWNTSIDSGRFSGCGAVITGVNDIPGESCIDVHKRLNVNHNGCLLPANYPSGTSDGTPPETPRNIGLK